LSNCFYFTFIQSPLTFLSLLKKICGPFYLDHKEKSKKRIYGHFKKGINVFIKKAEIVLTTADYIRVGY
jgi:hypothetical protein